MHQVVSRSKVSRTIIIYWSSTCLYSFGQVASLSVMGSSKSMCMTWAVAVSDVVCLKENLFHQLAWIDGDYCLINHTNDKWWIVYDQCEHPLLLRQSLMRHNLSSFCPCQKVPNVKGGLIFLQANWTYFQVYTNFIQFYSRPLKFSTLSTFLTPPPLSSSQTTTESVWCSFK